MKTGKILRGMAGVALILICAGCGSGKSEGTVTDVDGNVYQAVRIGNQVWLKENLRTTRFNDGTPIAHMPDPTEWRHTDQPAYVWPGNDESNKAVYGALYNWKAAAHPNLCPPGWRVPTDEDYKQLDLYLGMAPDQLDGSAWRGTDQGGKMKMAGTEFWEAPNEGATNESGFSAVPAGRRWSNGDFGDLGRGSTYWTSTEHSLSGAVYRHLDWINERSARNPNGCKKFGYAIRLIREN